MRPALFRALSLAVAALPMSAAALGLIPERLTIVLDFEGPYSQRSVAAMEHELEGIMQGSGLTIDWRMRSQTSNESYANLVMVRFKGKCILEPVGYLYDERGPLAFTYSTGETVLPFSEVACDKVTASVRSAMWGGDYAHADLLLGRALGRVVAHELVHILTRSGEHSQEGVAEPALTGNQLISSRLHLTPADLDRIREAAPARNR